MLSLSMLQQYLPFTVLKRGRNGYLYLANILTLQQYLPFTVLKLNTFETMKQIKMYVATVLTVHGIETR